MPIQIPFAEPEELWAKAVAHSIGKAHRIKIDKKIINIRKKVRNAAKQHLQLWIVLLDESLQFLIQMESLQLSKNLSQSSAVFAMLSARMKTLLISFRELILIGQEDSARLIARSYLETSELALVCMEDPEFCLEYAPDETDVDHEVFWRKRVGYGRIYPLVEKVLLRSGFEQDAIQWIITSHKSWKKVLSSSVHPSISSAFQTLFVPSLTSPGLLAFKDDGHLSIHSPSLCTMMITETFHFAVVFVKLLISKNPPQHLQGFDNADKLASALASAEVLQDLFLKYEDVLHSVDVDKFFPDADGTDKSLQEK